MSEEIAVFFHILLTTWFFNQTLKLWFQIIKTSVLRLIFLGPMYVDDL